MPNDAHSAADFSGELVQWTTKFDFRPWDAEKENPIISKTCSWVDELLNRKVGASTTREWYVLCALSGRDLLSKSMTIDREIRGGLPVLKGTGFTISQLLGEISENDGVSEISEDFDLDVATVRDFLNGLSLIFGRVYVR